MARGKGAFKNTKLGKNVYRQLKRRGPPQPFPARQHPARPQKPEKPANPTPPAQAKDRIVKVIFERGR